MRIGHMCLPVLGGSAMMARRLALAQAGAGHRTLLLSDGVPYGADLLAGVPLLRPAETGDPVAGDAGLRASRLVSLAGTVAREEGLDVLHVHYAQPYALLALAARDLLAPTASVVVTLHGSDVTDADPQSRPAVSAALARVDAVTAVSGHLALVAEHTLGVRPGHVVPNWAPETAPPASGAGLRARLLGPRGGTLLAHASNFRPVKQALHTVDVLAAVCESGPARLALAGDGPDRPAVLAYAARRGLSEHVVWLGPLASTTELLAAADLHLLPSRSEACSLATLEAAAAGTPTAAYAVGGMPDLVVDGVTGILVPPGDATRLAAGVTAAVAGGRLAAYGDAARAHVAEHFSRERTLAAYDEVYRGTRQLVEVA